MSSADRSPGSLAARYAGIADDALAQRARDGDRAAFEELVHRRAELERAVRALPEDYRVPLILRDIEGLSTHEAAAAMELSEAAFKRRLHRARLAVREVLEDHLDLEGDR